MLRATIAVCPLFVSAYSAFDQASVAHTTVAISRYEDHRHHPTDIIVRGRVRATLNRQAGSLLGTLFATVGYLLFFPSPFSSANYEAMATPRPLYGSERPVIALPVDDLEAAMADPAAAFDAGDAARR